MNTQPKIRNLAIPLCLLFLCGCVKPVSFPPEPYLEFRRNILGFETGVGGDTTYTLAVEFYFQDGDGDIGRMTESESGPYVGDSLYNLHFNLLEQQADGSFAQVYMPDSTGVNYPISYAYHLHYIEPVNANKSLRGTITWQVDDFASTAFFMKGKTVCYSFYLYDRALHKSNVVYTQAIKL